jgi:hypothetical protein
MKTEKISHIQNFAIRRYGVSIEYGVTETGFGVSLLNLPLINSVPCPFKSSFLVEVARLSPQ